ncbi:uncharacterized protein [Cicer arietinum]
MNHHQLNISYSYIVNFYLKRILQVFSSREAVFEWAKAIGRQNGILIVTIRSDKANGIRGRKDKLILGCERGGRYKSESKKSVTCSHKENCPFTLRCVPLSVGEGWKISVRCGTHNHELLDTVTGHSYLGRLNEEERKFVNDMTKYKLAPRFILNALKVRNETNVTIPSQIYKARSTYRSSLRGPYTEMQHLLKLIQQENYVHWTRRRENSDILRDIFWTHPDCIKLLNTFHFVLICDSTYKTNRYRLPLLEIVGVTSTSLTFSVGFAYLEKERQDNFIWAFEKVRMLFKSESLISKVIVTDRDLAMMNAISVVFPTSIHLLCRFHIEKNVGARCKQYVKKDRQEEVMDLWKKIVYSTSVEEYDHHLQQFEILCADIILFVDYVKDSWLTPYKERFVNVWTNRVMHLGNTTSNRVESAHWRLKNMLQTSFGDLCKSWDAVNMMLKNQICIIQSSFQKTIKDVEHGYNSQFFQNLHHCVSRKCMKLIDKQLERVKIVGTNKTECGCSIRTTHGLPCACELAKLQIYGNVIPLDSIHDFWKQLSIAHELEDEESLSDYDFSEELEAMKAYMKKHDIISQRIFKAKVREVVFPHTTSILAPPEKVRTKGAGKKKKEFDTPRDSSYWEYVDASQESAKARQPSQSSQRSARQQSQSSQHSFKTQFPTYIRPYIEDIVDVVADGNCGFRAIAALLVRNSLQISKLGAQGKDKWMSLPDLDYVIATLYNVILVSLSRNLNMTFFPLNKSPSKETFVHSLLAIGFVNENHWVQIKLKSDCPLPPTSQKWKDFCSDTAKSWEVAYAARMKHWKHIDPSFIRSSCISLNED